MDYLFGQLTQSSDGSLIRSCINVYRERYGKIGYAENQQSIAPPQYFEDVVTKLFDLVKFRGAHTH